MDYAILEVNHGRWVAECPRCHFALQISRGFPRLRCGFLPDGRWLEGQGCGFDGAVEWPAFADEIETVLAARPMQNRNWKQGETVADLLAENLSYMGVG